MDASLNYRLKGNEIYQSLNNNLAPAIIQSRLTEAQKLYNLALKEAHNKLDQSSACKNLFRIFIRFQEFYSNQKTNSEKNCFYSKMAQQYASDALRHGENVQNNKWIANIKLEAINSFNCYYYENLINNSFKKRINDLIELKKCSIDEVCALINYRICDCYFRIANDFINSSLIENAWSTNHECDFYYEESLKHFKENNSMFQTINELREDYILQRITLEGLKSKKIAQNLLDECINKHENLNIEQIWDIIDWYRDSISKLKGKDVECEAELLSDIGFIYDEILLTKDKAKINYKLSWHLADSLRPKILTHFKWYKRCANAIERYQQEILEEEQQSFAAQKKKVYEKIKEDIEKIKEKVKNGSYEFLPFIYKEYPPKNPNHTFSDNLNSKNLKKSIQNAIFHYHPDKNSKEQFGNEWFFIADEITKNLTHFYEGLKNIEN